MFRHHLGDADGETGEQIFRPPALPDTDTVFSRDRFDDAHDILIVFMHQRLQLIGNGCDLSLQAPRLKSRIVMKLDQLVVEICDSL